MLKLSDNRKTSFKKNHLNTFGLMYGLPENGGTCPGATTGNGGCLDVRDGHKRQTCYMAKIVMIYKAVGNVLQSNTEMLSGKSVDEMVEVCKNTVAEFIKKNKGDNLFFRLHYSGDFFSKEYTEAWAITVKQYPNVHFWVYTRSHDMIDPLLGLDNITVFLSCDPSNYDKVKQIFEDKKQNNKNLGMAFMGNDAPAQDENRWVKCPEITGKVLNDDKGGACSKCRLCVDNYKIRVKNIQFPIH
jgi:hypothetical protein